MQKHAVIEDRHGRSGVVGYASLPSTVQSPLAVSGATTETDKHNPT